MAQKTVNLFFACDERYLPLFGVALTSIRNHRDPHRSYRTVVLHTGISEEVQRCTRRALSAPGFSLAFRDVTKELAAFRDRLHTRDYYTNATYYRLLIPALYPRMERALYLDSDILVRGDVAPLFDTPLDGCLAAAVPDGFVNFAPVLRKYVENRVGVPGDMPYFNAGVLLMNLVEMRKIGFGDLFVSLLSHVTFRVAQDQDYLNVICRGRVKFLSERWNYMPFRYAEGEEPFLVHFNLDSKPWQKEGVPYGEEFWACADATPFAQAMREKRASYSEEDARRAAQETERLVATAVAESEDTEECRRTALRIRRVMRKAESVAAPALCVSFSTPPHIMGAEGRAL